MNWVYTAKELRTEEEVNADNAVGDALTGIYLNQSSVNTFLPIFLLLAYSFFTMWALRFRKNQQDGKQKIKFFNKSFSILRYKDLLLLFKTENNFPIVLKIRVGFYLWSE